MAEPPASRHPLDGLVTVMWHYVRTADDLPRVDPASPSKVPRDVFAYVIHEGKVRAPAGAMELIERVK